VTRLADELAAVRRGDIILRPLTLAAANAQVTAWHRHHHRDTGHLFSVGAFVDGKIVGVAMVGRPKAPALQDGVTYELTRLATPPNAIPHVASKLIAACWRAARAIGVRRMVSYTRIDEEGTCYRAAGWTPVAAVKGRPWDSGNKADRWLPGLYEPTTEIIDRVRWEVVA
jgi:hypothetical protein